MPPSSRPRAFTLLEVLIVVLIIGILLAIAVPQWVRSREVARRQACVANLRRIASAKEQCTINHRLPQGGTIEADDLVGDYLKGDAFPVCPAGGDYTIGLVGEEPSCSEHPD